MLDIRLLAIEIVNLAQMTNDWDEIITNLLNLFPNQIKVYDLGSLHNLDRQDTASLIHKNFREFLSKESTDNLIWEIAHYLKDKEQSAFYSFFYRTQTPDFSECEWFLSSARLNKCENGLPKEIVIFTYNLQFFGDLKMKLYRMLENEEFFKEHFEKVSSLTKREKETIALLAAGMSSPEIAAALYISVNTVNTHRKSINNKLAIKSIAGLLKFADVFELTTRSLNCEK